MEGYAYSYPDSGDSSPRSREIEFDNPPPSWVDDQPPPPLPPNHKVKFLVSYGGKIQPRNHDNQLSYVGGDTKILAVDRSTPFSSLLSKLSSLLSEDSNNPVCISSFKYQLPGEDLDALISVTNDDDLDHLMHEYDRLYRSSPKPARLRLFAFPAPSSGSQFGSGSERDGPRFVEPPPPPAAPVVVAPPQAPTNNVDFLFGLENKVPVPNPERVIGSDPQIDARIQELNRLQISPQDQQLPLPPAPQPAPIYRPRSEESVVSDVYQKPPPTIPASVQVPATYWQQPPPMEHHQQPPPPPPQTLAHPPPPQQQQQVYMIHAPLGQPQANVYHAPPMMRPPVTNQLPQGYYREHQQIYAAAPVRQVSAGETAGYQVAYDSATGRQVYYAAPGGVVTAPFQGVSGGEMIRPNAAGLTTAEGKVVTKVLPSSAVV